MNSKITLFTIFLVALLLLAPSEARRSAPTVAPAKHYDQDVAGLGLYGRGFPHAWGVDKSSTTTKNHNAVQHVVKKKNKKVQRRSGKNEEM
ncbi:unnamed protein product [Cylindrotheca closterium]|uniref:Uncharacterized protein n=1 Tax=Cylindrotheca closterium TaxID=2856 RepID=A0AAD2FSC6_9STRA|nr:unnamed protein product [Cylindrotheca closterium]